MEDITADQLREWRLRSGMTQEKLGLKLGLKKVAITKIENGTRQISAPEQKLLRMLILGEVPFQTTDRFQTQNTELKFSTEQWQVIAKAAQKEGYSDTNQWIVDKIKSYLRMNPQTTSDQLAAEAPPPYNVKS